MALLIVGLASQGLHASILGVSDAAYVFNVAMQEDLAQALPVYAYFTELMRYRPAGQLLRAETARHSALRYVHVLQNSALQRAGHRTWTAEIHASLAGVRLSVAASGRVVASHRRCVLKSAALHRQESMASYCKRQRLLLILLTIGVWGLLIVQYVVLIKQIERLMLKHAGITVQIHRFLIRCVCRGLLDDHPAPIQAPTHARRCCCMSPPTPPLAHVCRLVALVGVRSLRTDWRVLQGRSTRKSTSQE